ncbi:MAG: DUF421 domain-containing protein [Sciscionella sp.]
MLLYLTALAGLRLGSRRTVAQMSPFDFVTAVAMGAIIGRAATAGTTSFVVGAVAVLTLIVVHRGIGLLRLIPGVSRMTDHRVRVLVAHGRMRERQLWLCELTRDDLYAELRQSGHTRLADLQYVLYERAGGLTVIPTGRGTDGDIITAALDSAPDG